MKIHVYAALKDFFEKEQEVTTDFKTVAEVKEFLILENKKAEKLINACRFAVGNEFVEVDFLLKHNDTVSIIPPSSGG